MSKPERAKYVIIDDFDAPQPNMVCQWVPSVGYCYLDRSKASFDGMKGHEATSVEAFGFVWTDNPDGTVSFYLSERPCVATYQDGEPRQWQSRTTGFEFQQLQIAIIQKRKARA